MLVLSRQRDESIVIDVPPSDHHQVVTVTIVDIRGDKVRMGFDGERCVEINRKEVRDRKQGRPRNGEERD